MSTKSKGFETKRIRLNMKNANVNIVHINHITAPEFLIIRKIHGEGAAQIVEDQGTDIETRLSEDGKRLQRIRPVSSLIQRLTDKYGAERFKSVFPGENPILPYTYEDAGLLDLQNGDIDDVGEGWEPMDVGVTEVPAKKDAKKASAKKLDDLIGVPPTETSAA